ncbi:MAG: RrF2 family transcriptional regulator [Sphingomonadales bacterium]|jgi:FeS assembly SUF system regulator|uniref:RrF2 family transcriptional regulator n=1 Tax=Sphingorhabdus sp. TaxID=1902408 RepID=UPI001B6E0181|nr:Rrf2 family transcriptional regulator [Sphingorhabdus sp.]WRH76949.1 MAG: Rrf2 family transcriptional regulator [Sphingobium sp.]
MRLSNMADYAVVVMGAAARHCGGVRTSATALSEETGIALPTVQKLVSILTKGGLLRSVRGAGGGIQLSRPAAAITLADIIEAVEGPIAMTSCVNATSCNCVIEPDCNVKPHWTAVNQAIRGALADVSLSSLAAGR